MRVCPCCDRDYDESQCAKCPLCHTWSPNADDIAVGCELIQAGWTRARELAARRIQGGSEPVLEVTEVHCNPCGRRVMRERAND